MQIEGGGFIFSNPGRNPSECQGFFTCSVDSAQVWKLHGISENQQALLLPQLILLKAHIEMVLELRSKGGRLIDVICTQTHFVHTGSVHKTTCICVCMWLSWMCRHR